MSYVDQEQKRKKYEHNRKGQASLFADAITLDIKDHKYSTRKLLGMTETLSKLVRYKINRQKYIKNKSTKKEPEGGNNYVHN